MTKFESVGIGYQHDSASKEQAIKRMNYSCMVCCNRGIRLDCDKCAISITHNIVLSAFDMILEEENTNEAQDL